MLYQQFLTMISLLVLQLILFRPHLLLQIKRMVNYAVTNHKLKINADKKTISLNLQIDAKICSMCEYFEIFLERMMMCRGTADMLGATFKLMANGSKVL